MSVVRIADPALHPAHPARRAGLVVLLLVSALVLQSTLFTSLTLFGVVPQLVFVVVICLAAIESENLGLVSAFSGGLLVDLVMPGSLLGLTSLVLTLVAYCTSRASQLAPEGSVGFPVVAVALGSVAAEILYAFFSVLLGQNWVSLGDTVRIGALIVLYNTLLAPLILTVVRWSIDVVRGDRGRRR